MTRLEEISQAICRRLTVSGVLGGERVLGSGAAREIEAVLKDWDRPLSDAELAGLKETYDGGPFPEADVPGDFQRLIQQADRAADQVITIEYLERNLIDAAEKVQGLEAEVQRLKASLSRYKDPVS